MGDFQQTRLWQRTLALRKRSDPHAAARERLRSALLKMRERAELVAGEIVRDLPEFTVHDITHLDALWELSDLISPSNFALSPTEAFALGGAFLIHDLGMGLAAYPEGRAGLRSDPFWDDTVAALLKEKLGRLPSAEECANPSSEVELEAISELLRLRHARHSDHLATTTWRGPDGEGYHMIEDPELRQVFGPLIGQVAHSHWWTIDEVRRSFADLSPLGAPAFLNCPKDWTLDRLKIGCLLRAADSAHLDARRAPGFLRALRKPSSYADLHWTFQQHLPQPQLDGERLVFTASPDFAVAEAQAWWVGYDLLRMCDETLREVDTLLQDLKRSYRLAARGVAGVEEPERLVIHIPTRDWLPVDTRIRVTDVAGLVGRLGGEQLYGNDAQVPLRELLQNACDAIRARRLLDEKPAHWGKIKITLGKDDVGRWIDVADTGVGMSSRLLRGPFLDFGQSFWETPLMREEYPGLQALGFSPTGRFGIGFFSVFMWGSRVRITTRRFEAAHHETKILEFQGGLQARPILRNAEPSEYRREGGTSVRIWLTTVAGRETWLSTLYKLAENCKILCPSLDATLFVAADDVEESLLIEADDWLRAEPSELLARVPDASYDQARIETFLTNVRVLHDSQGTPIGRGCVVCPPSWWARGVVTVGGLMVDRLPHVFGVFAGITESASRKSATLLATKDEMADWASEQAQLISHMSLQPGDAAYGAAVICYLAGNIGSLPIAVGEEGWMDSAAVRRCFSAESQLTVVIGEFVEDLSCPKAHLLLPSAGGHPKKEVSTFNALLEALSLAWSCSPSQIQRRELGYAESEATIRQVTGAGLIDKVLRRFGWEVVELTRPML